MRFVSIIIFIVRLIVLFAFEATLLAQNSSALRIPAVKAFTNLDFEEGPSGQSPEGWKIPPIVAEAGFQAVVVEGDAASGKRYVRLSKGAEINSQFGNIMQAVDARPYRGRRIQLRAKLRLEGEKPDGFAQLWMRVDRRGGVRGFFDNTRERPVQASVWTELVIVGDVALDAECLNIGMIVQVSSGACLDGVTLEVLGPAPTPSVEAARPLDARGLRNLEAFGRALSLVRFFYPGDAAAAADWNAMAVEGVRRIEKARNDRLLVQALSGYFARCAPTAKFRLGGEHKDLSLPVGAVSLVRWFHRGFGQSNPGTYSSKREYVDAATRPEEWSDPQKPWVAELVEGLFLDIPTVLPVDKEKATLPKPDPISEPKPGAPKVATLTLPTAGTPGYTADDRATRLGDVVLAWGILKHFYPYFDVVEADWEAELPRALRKAASDRNATEFLRTMAVLVAALKDGHGRVDGPKAELKHPSLSVIMLGGQPFVLRSEAERVPAGSQILKLDGRPVAVRIGQLRREISAATEGWMGHRIASEILAGPSGSRLSMEFRTAAGEARQVFLDRGTYLMDFNQRGRPGNPREIQPGIWYVDLSRMTDKGFEGLVPKLSEARGVIFDLRRHPNLGTTFLQHLSDKPLESARWKVARVTRPDGVGLTWSEARSKLLPKEPRIKGRVAFLTGGGAMSYNETCMGIVEAYKLAEIVGDPTAGTNGNINPFFLPGGLNIWWTGMKVLKHDGSRHHGVGIQPTVPVKPTAKGLAEGRDEVLEKAIEIVSK